MDRHTSFDPGVFSPFGTMFQNYFSQFDSFGRGDAVSGGFAPGFDAQALSVQQSSSVKTAARAQLEVAGLANRRLQAYLQVPSQLAKCRSPMDIFNEQMAFWRTAGEQYLQCSQRIAEVWGHAVPWHTPFETAKEPQSSHDYINFNGSGEQVLPPVAPTRAESGKQRRVA